MNKSNNNQDNYPVFQQFDEPKPFESDMKIIVGEYYKNKAYNRIN